MRDTLALDDDNEKALGRSMLGYSRRGFLGLIAAGICAPYAAKETARLVKLTAMKEAAIAPFLSGTICVNGTCTVPVDLSIESLKAELERFQELFRGVIIEFPTRLVVPGRIESFLYSRGYGA